MTLPVTNINATVFGFTKTCHKEKAYSLNIILTVLSHNLTRLHIGLEQNVTVTTGYPIQIVLIVKDRKEVSA